MDGWMDGWMHTTEIPKIKEWVNRITMAVYCADISNSV